MPTYVLEAHEQRQLRGSRSHLLNGVPLSGAPSEPQHVDNLKRSLRKRMILLIMSTYLYVHFLIYVCTLIYIYIYIYVDSTCMIFVPHHPILYYHSSFGFGISSHAGFLAYRQSLLEQTCKATLVVFSIQEPSTPLKLLGPQKKHPIHMFGRSCSKEAEETHLLRWKGTIHCKIQRPCPSPYNTELDPVGHHALLFHFWGASGQESRG